METVKATKESIQEIQVADQQQQSASDVAFS